MLFSSSQISDLIILLTHLTATPDRKVVGSNPAGLISFFLVHTARLSFSLYDVFNAHNSKTFTADQSGHIRSLPKIPLAVVETTGCLYRIICTKG